MPFWTSEPVPLMEAEEKLVPCTTSPERLKASVPLTVIALLVDRLPVAPPLPIWSVPVLIIVVPL